MITKSTVSQISKAPFSEQVKILMFAIFPFMTWIGKIRPRTLKSDANAAITSAIFALPQSLAFALIAGLPPEFGLYAAIIAPIFTALFGCSWHTVSGPTVATSIVLLGIVSTMAVPGTPEFIRGVILLTFLAGVIQFLLGVFRLGHVVNFISNTVILGFSSGAALLIMSSQLKGVLGIEIERQDNITDTLTQTYYHLPSVNYHILFLSLSTFFVAIVCKKLFKKAPYLLIAMIYGGVVAAIMTYGLNVQTITMVGSLPNQIPDMSAPEIEWHKVRELFAAAIALATLGLIQSVSITKTIAMKTGQTIDANQEFVGQGLANIACSFTSGFFSSGSFSRTGVNYSAGAVTPMSSMIASGIILLVLLFASGVTNYLPAASMAAIIMLVGMQLIDLQYIRKVITTSLTETSVYIITLMSTLFLSLEFAIYSGMFLSLVIYLQRTSTPTVLHMTIDKLDPYNRVIPLRSHRASEHPQLEIVRVDGSLFFGSIEHIRKEIDIQELKYGTYILLICESVNLLDVSGKELLVFIRNYLRNNGGDLYLASLTPEVRKSVIKSPYWKKLGGRNNIFDYQAEATEFILNKIEEGRRQSRAEEEKQSTKTSTLLET